MLESRLDAELQSREREIREDESISMPELSDEIRDISEAAECILNMLGDAEEGELSIRTQRIFDALHRVFDDGDGDRATR